jgi:hypothetical protein
MKPNRMSAFNFLFDFYRTLHSKGNQTIRSFLKKQGTQEDIKGDGSSETYFPARQTLLVMMVAALAAICTLLSINFWANQ